MIVLGIETATSVCGVGLSGEDGLKADYRVNQGAIHAERLPVLVQNILQDAGVSPEDISGIAVSLGPGSFTGLRIGLGLAKGLAMGWGKPLIGVPTMAGLIFSAPRVCKRVCILLTARKGEFYLGLFQNQKENWVSEGDIQTVETEDVFNQLPEESILFLGEGAVTHQKMLQEKLKNAVFISETFSLPSGFGVAEKGKSLLKAGKVSDIDSLVPLYIKRFQGVA